MTANRLSPQSSILRGPGGLEFDLREWLSFRQRYDAQWQTVQNGASRLSGRRRGIDQEEYWIGINVPEGRRLIVWSDILKLSENEYDIDIFDAPDGFTGGTEGVRRKLGRPETEPIESQLFFGVTPSNEATHTIRLEDFVDTGNVQGPGRPAVSPEPDDTFQVLTGHILIRIARQGTEQAYTLAYRAVVWEYDGQAELSENGD